MKRDIYTDHRPPEDNLFGPCANCQHNGSPRRAFFRNHHAYQMPVPTLVPGNISGHALFDDGRFSLAMQNVIDRRGLSREQVADMLGISSDVLSKYLQPYSYKKSRVPVHLAAPFDMAIGEPVLLRLIAEQEGFVLVPKPKSNTISSIGQVEIKHGKTIYDFGRAISDGSISEHEASLLLDDIGKEIQELAGLEHHIILAATMGGGF